MASTPTLDERKDRLGAAIAAARAKLEARQSMEWVGIGSLLEELNDEVEEARDHDEPAAHARYDSIESRLAEAQARIEADPEAER